MRIQMTSPRILVVDDDRSNCRILSKILSAQGYQVDIAENGEQALALVASTDYGLALLDYKMPGMDGVELYRRIRQIRPEMPGVFQTAFAKIEVIYSAIEAGAERILAKPVDTQELLPLVERLVGKSMGASHRATEPEPVPEERLVSAAASISEELPDEEADARQALIERLARSAAGGPEAIEQRLKELDREWGAERAIEVGAAALGLCGVALASTGHRRWLFLSAIAGGVLLEQSLGQGVSAVFGQQLRLRTEREIAVERCALKALRGDFLDLDFEVSDLRDAARQALTAAER
jgi:CheY-like chemotaxis protein